MKQLPFNYDVTVDKMVPMTPVQETEEFKLDTASFINPSNGFEQTEMRVLKFDNKQIMQMDDGKFVLEVEIDEYCGYWFSESLEDVINGSTEINDLEDFDLYPNAENDEFGAEETDYEEVDENDGVAFGGLNARFSEEEED